MLPNFTGFQDVCIPPETWKVLLSEPWTLLEKQHQLVVGGSNGEIFNLCVMWCYIIFIVDILYNTVRQLSAVSNAFMSSRFMDL